MSYAELHCKTNFSFLEGASHASELVACAVEAGYAALAVTDRNTLAGVVRAHGAAKDRGLPLIVGAELHLQDAPPVVLWAVGRRRATKGECLLRWDDLAAHAEGLLAGVSLRGAFSWRNQRMSREAGRMAAGEESGIGVACDECPRELRTWWGRYRELFGDRVYLLAELFRGPEDARWLAAWKQWSQASGVPLVASGEPAGAPDRPPYVMRRSPSST